MTKFTTDPFLTDFFALHSPAQAASNVKLTHLKLSTNYKSAVYIHTRLEFDAHHQMLP